MAERNIRVGGNGARQHRAAADRIIIAHQRLVPARQPGGKAHAVAVRLQKFAHAEDQVARFLERHPVEMGAAGANAAIVADRLKDGGDGIGIDIFRAVARQAEQDRAVGGMAPAGQRQRAVKFALHPHRTGRQRIHEHQRGAHRPDRVRTGRADADGEQIHHADRGGAVDARFGHVNNPWKYAGWRSGGRGWKWRLAGTASVSPDIPSGWRYSPARR